MPGNRPLDCFRNVQLEMARYGRLTGSFLDLALTEEISVWSSCRILIPTSSVVFFSTRGFDSLNQLETAIKFFDSNLKILHFSEKSSKKDDHSNHANRYYSNKCPKPKREKASAGLLEPQVAAASLELQLFAVALELECPVVALDAEDSGSDLSGDDWEESDSVYDLPWEGDGRVALDGGLPGVVLEDFPEVPVELAESFEIPNRIPVELAESLEIPNRIPVELAEVPEIPFDSGFCLCCRCGLHGTRLATSSRRSFDITVLEGSGTAPCGAAATSQS